MKISYKLQKLFWSEKAKGKANAQAAFYGIGDAREKAKRYGIIGENLAVCMINDVLSLGSER